MIISRIWQVHRALACFLYKVEVKSVTLEIRRVVNFI